MQDNTDGIFRARPIQKVAALVIPCLASLPIMVMPFIFGAVIDQVQVDSSNATYATSAEISMIALASLLVSIALKVLPPRLTALIGLSLAAIGHFLSIGSTSLEPMIIARAIAGFGEGLCMGMGFATLAQIIGGTRLLAYSSGIVAAASLISFITVPALQSHLGSSSIFWFMLVVTLICFPLFIWMPTAKLKQLPNAGGVYALFNIKSFSLFLVAFLASSGSNTLWLYFEQVGHSAGMDLAAIGKLGSFSSIPTLLVPFVANFVFARNKTVVPIAVVCLLSGIASYFYGAPPSVIAFCSVVVIMSFLYVFLIAYIRMFSAHLDSSGRTTAAVGGADSLGMVVGPLVAAFTLNLTTGFSSLSSFGLALQSLCVIPCLGFLFYKASRHTRSVGNA
ncbi:MFS transporter [Pseudomonas sp. NFACC13-1]|uniref:MFS transporter n=1 Tax=Pseudomonas sp. NFACC13-1 TaxID=1566245 RepID=UPI00088D5C16|nr:MFS transporter [Pseudomonas sp. NFACC13-1]SDB67182.1 Predicted arabinose efflux permease, MFS family [Pseudomonas sp. NFACC13-1]